MKKLFTLMAAALFAVSASADEVTLKENVADGSTLTIAEIEAAGGADADLITIYITNKSGESRAGWGAGGFGKSSGWDTAVEFTGQEGDSWTFEYTVADIKEVAGTDDGIRFRIWSDYSIDKITLQPSITYGDAKAISFDETGFIAASEFAGLNEGAKIVITYNVAGDVTSYVGWGIGRLGSNDDTGDGPSVTVLSFSSTALGDLEATCKYSDIKKALEATPDGVKATFWGFGDGKCTASLVKVEAFDVVSDDAGEESATPVSISWGADDIAAKGTLNGKTFGEDFKLTITDTDESKLEIDANNVYFGDATNQTKFTHRLKSGGKSSSNNKLTLTIPSKGTLKVYARTGSNSATDRHLVLTQDAELFNEIIQEADAIQVKGLDEKDLEKETNVYPIISVPVEKGTVEITYPDGSMNFYGFEFIGTTGIQETIAPAKVISNDAIYNLAGQKVNESYKGIVIKNGKKFIQK